MEICPRYYSYVRVGERIWFSLFNFNGLFSLDVSTDSLKYEHYFENVSSEFDLFRREIINYGENLYFFPKYGSQILCYNMITKKESVINISTAFDNISIMAVKQWKNKLGIVFSDLSQGLFVLDMSTNMAARYEKISRLILNYKTKWEYGDIVNTDAENISIQFIDWDIQKLVIVDLEGETVSEIDLPKSSAGEKYTLKWLNDQYWIRPDKFWKKLFRWEVNTGRITDESVNDLLITKPDSNFIWDIYFFEEKIYILMKFGDVIEIDDKRGTRKRCFDPTVSFSMIDKFQWEAAFGRLEFVNGEMWCHPCLADRYVIYNLKTGNLRTKKVCLNVDKIPDFDKRMYNIVQLAFKDAHAIHEVNQRISLEEFCYGAGTIDGYNEHVHKSIGKTIMEYVLSGID